MEQDVYDARCNPERKRVLHAFGDGATHTSQDRAGWGVVIYEQTGRNTRSELMRDRGRLPGKQANDSAETQAILRALLHTHPKMSW